MVACGPPAPPQSAAKDPTEPKNPNPQTIATGPVELQQRDEDRNIVWSLSATGSKLSYKADGKVSGALEGIKGALFEKGAKVSSFSAERGEADQTTEALAISGNVIVHSLKDGAKLSADSVEWVKAKQWIVAKGRVKISTSDYVLGPFEQIVATADLVRFGTPDQFRD